MTKNLIKNFTKSENAASESSPFTQKAKEIDAQRLKEDLILRNVQINECEKMKVKKFFQK